MKAGHQSHPSLLLRLQNNAPQNVKRPQCSPSQLLQTFRKTEQPIRLRETINRAQVLDSAEISNAIVLLQINPLKIGKKMQNSDCLYNQPMHHLSENKCPAYLEKNAKKLLVREECIE